MKEIDWSEDWFEEEYINIHDYVTMLKNIHNKEKNYIIVYENDIDEFINHIENEGWEKFRRSTHKYGKINFFVLWEDMKYTCTSKPNIGEYGVVEFGGS